MFFLRLCSRCVGSAWVPRPCPALDGGPLCVRGRVRARSPHSYHLGRGDSVLGGSGAFCLGSHVALRSRLGLVYCSEP